MEAGDSIIGKRLLVGLTYLDDNDEIKERTQLYGSITSIADNTIVFERADEEGPFSVPFDGELELADPEATYTLSSTGEEVTQVDLLCSWTIYPPQDD